MFDWFRRHDETGTEQVVASEQAPGNPQPALELLANGQTLPELAPAAVAAMAEAGDAGLGGPSDQGDDAAEAQQQTRQLGPVAAPLDGSQGDESACPISSEALPPPLSGRGSARRPGRRLLKAEVVERSPLTGEQRLWILDTWKRSGLPAGDFAPWSGCRSTRCTVGRSSSPNMVRRG